MLYGYPIAATAKNWLHQCVCEAVSVVHQRLAIGKSLPAWPRTIPKKYRARLATRRSLRDHLTAYAHSVSKLSQGERDFVFQVLAEQNRIAQLVSSKRHCRAIDDLPPSVRTPVSNLFACAFDLLKDFGVRDEQYRYVYDASRGHVCAFCGLEYFEAPGGKREALDHYLVREQYPFASANLRNLVPMGHKCNSSYKGSKDVLRKSTGQRRRAIDPYAHVDLRISLDKSIPFQGIGKRIPKWTIEFSRRSESIDTWDDVFSIRERYKRDVLDAEFDSWLETFWVFCRFAAGAPTTDADVVRALSRYIDVLDSEGLAGRAFLKAAMFRMLRIHCGHRNQRLLKLLRVGIRSAQALNAGKGPTA
jgi:hypothetical protein